MWREFEMILPVQLFGYGFPWSTVLIVAFYAGVITIWALVARWVYKDAEERGMDAVLWAVLVFLFGLIALIIYLVKRPS
jgi:hypothetical protein